MMKNAQLAHSACRRSIVVDGMVHWGRRTSVVVAALMGIHTIAGFSDAGAQSQSTSTHPASGATTSGATDRVRDSLLALPTYRREHMMVAPALYDRYRRPGMCFSAVWRAYNFYYRDKRPDTIFVDVRKKVLPPVVRQLADACASKFDLTQIPTGQLAPFVAVSLYRGQDQLADSAYRRMLRDMPGRDSAELRYKATQLLGARHAVSRTLRHEPSWWLRIAADIDSLGPAVARISLVANDLRVWADPTVDADLGISGYQKAEAAFKKMPRSEQFDWAGDMYQSYGGWGTFQAWKYGPQSVSEFYEKRSVPTMASLSPGDNSVLHGVRSYFEGLASPYQVYGQPAPAIPAKHWFYAEGVTPNKFPWEGQPTLVAFVHPNCGGPCYPEYSFYRMLHDKFGARGLRILLVARTSGFFRNEAIEVPSQEVELIRKYYLDFLKMPVTLVVDEARFNRLPDGRRIAEDIPWYRTWPNDGTVLIGRDGKIKATKLVRAWWERASVEVEKEL
jgi:hypothetical protein